MSTAERSGNPSRPDPLVRTGLSAAPDPMSDRFAALARRLLGVRAAVVALTGITRQVFPGASGLDRRETPLAHTLPAYAVADARTDQLLAGHPVIEELSAGGYAGVPLTGADGEILGAMCVIDTVAREWTADELGLLAELAAACSESLRLRIATRSASRREHNTRARERAADAAADRSRLLLRASVALANTATVTDVVEAVQDLVTGTLNPDYVGVSLLDATGQIDLRAGDTLAAPIADHWRHYPSTARTPSAVAAATGVPVLLPDLEAVAAHVPDAAATFEEMGWQAGASVPLPGPDGPIGALTFVWKQPYSLDEAEQAVLAALAGYVAQALRRAEYLYSREQVAELLQQAMLSDLPEAEPYELAARYEPAARGEHVGGDWYDAVRVDAGRLALVVGDVTGHDMHAAARMGQLRSMLRAYLVDRHEPPSALLRRLDNAMQILGGHTPATALLAYVDRDGDGHRLQWANAGHPTPLLIEKDGTVTQLTGRDILLGVLRRTPRSNHSRRLPPGATLLIYTDGLIETRTDPIDDRKRQLREALSGLAGAPLPDLLNEILARFAGHDHEDDVALLALRCPGEPDTVGRPVSVNQASRRPPPDREPTTSGNR
ncbi:GAF domain-containing SpoIIE family protein phosphatase [Actinoplanes sp. NPDC051861]|uniref:PP2C family protein-serine/threonine phosphatase n=1 Tax=Actinoplanes sp. NPDC051861 TaxID=3155170 RepID=UPI00344335DC